MNEDSRFFTIYMVFSDDDSKERCRNSFVPRKVERCVCQCFGSESREFGE